MDDVSNRAGRWKKIAVVVLVGTAVGMLAFQLSHREDPLDEVPDRLGAQLGGAGHEDDRRQVDLAGTE